MKRIRFLLTPLALGLGLLSFGSLAMAQPPQTDAAAHPASAGLAPDQARAALSVLQNDAERAKLIAVLQAIAAVQPVISAPAAVPPTKGAAAHPTAPTMIAVPVPVPATTAAAPSSDTSDKPTIELAPNSVGAQLLVGASQEIAGLSDKVVVIAREITDFPLLWFWLTQLAYDQQMQASILDAAWRLVVVVGLGLVAGLITRRLVRRPLQSMRDRAPATLEQIPDDVEGIAEAEAGQTEWTRRRANAVTFLRRLPYGAGCFCVDLLPMLSVAAVSYALLAGGLSGEITSRLVILAVLNAYLAWRLVVAIANAVASPKSTRLRLIPVNDDSAAVIVRETSLLSAVAIAGTTIAETALLFGLYQVAHDALLKLNLLLVFMLVARILLRNRRPVKMLLRAPEGRKGVLAALRNGLASSWHRIVIFYMLALWLVWALDIDNGFTRLLQLMVSAVAVTIGARLAIIAGEACLERLHTYITGLDERYPGTEARLSSYHPLLRALLNICVFSAAIVLLLQSWGVDALSWMSPDALGGRLANACGTIVATLVAALAVWELANAAIARHLAQLARSAQLSRSARLRTLLPMFRTTLMVTVCLVAGLLVLSEIGVNIAPLLAGAGVIGLAIGFGSQKLVQDIITGLFLLLENAMQVGDVVTLGGMTGTVENLSIRTIRLRSVDGSVHIVPFSAVTTVTNSTRDYGFAVVDVSVGVNEEPDHIADVLKDIAAKMRTESPWRGLILADLEVMGVDKFLATVWVMRVRIKTLPASRWSVGREINRRIKITFDELAIESPMTSYRALGMATSMVQPNTQDPAEIS